MTLVGAILHGGRSSRMGTDKAFVVVEGLPMRDHVRTLLQQVCTRVVQVGGVVPGGVADIVDAGDGPFGAVLALLSSGIAERYLVCAVDQPFMSVEVLQPLIDADSEGVSWEHEPLPVCLHVSALPRLSALYANDERRLSALSTTTLPFLSASDASGGTQWHHQWHHQRHLQLRHQLRNLNRPEDLL